MVRLITFTILVETSISPITISKRTTYYWKTNLIIFRMNANIDITIKAEEIVFRKPSRARNLWILIIYCIVLIKELSLCAFWTICLASIFIILLLVLIITSHISTQHIRNLWTSAHINISMALWTLHLIYISTSTSIIRVFFIPVNIVLRSYLNWGESWWTWLLIISVRISHWVAFTLIYCIRASIVFYIARSIIHYSRRIIIDGIWYGATLLSKIVL